MSAVHTELAGGRWRTFSLVEQLANVGSEVERARHRRRLKELTRLREVLLDYFFGSNDFGSSDLAWHRYFHAFGVAAATQGESSGAR